MKYFILIPFLILCNCTQTNRAGGLYDPHLYTKMRAEHTNEPVIKNGIAGQAYHSALGNLCTHYTDNTNQTLVCNDGTADKQVRILQ